MKKSNNFHNQNITFEHVNKSHQVIIFEWLNNEHVKEFWDNSQEHKDDIINFINGRVKPSRYFNGNFVYWIGSIDGNPYCLLMTIQEKPEEKKTTIKNNYLSKTGTTYSIDYMIGNKDFVGKGLGTRTLEEFVYFFKKQCDHNADTFFIDPDEKNSKARHVYAKAGFKYVGDFIMEGDGIFAGHKTNFMVKKI